jgi:molybdate transport system substrate-binding protein
MRAFVLALALLLANVAPAAEVRVYAAASLVDALQEIAAGYEGDPIVFNFGASSLLARQIEAGAPADLFLSADEAKMDALQKRGLIVASTRASVLSNTLVIVVPRGATRITSPAGLVGKTVALAEPSSVPAGIYARTFLEGEGLWKQIAPHVVPTENVRGALAAVRAGNADAAIVYKTDALTAKDVTIAVEIPREKGPRISYPFALVTDTGQPDAARRFLAYLRSQPALDVFARHGFLIR